MPFSFSGSMSDRIPALGIQGIFQVKISNGDEDDEEKDEVMHWTAGY